MLRHSTNHSSNCCNYMDLITCLHPRCRCCSSSSSDSNINSCRGGGRQLRGSWLRMTARSPGTISTLHRRPHPPPRRICRERHPLSCRSPRCHRIRWLSLKCQWVPRAIGGVTVPAACRPALCTVWPQLTGRTQPRRTPAPRPQPPNSRSCRRSIRGRRRRSSSRSSSHSSSDHQRCPLPPATGSRLH